MKIHISNFVRRQTPESGFSHWIISDESLIKLIENALPNAKRGYREGVLLVPVSPVGFYSGVTYLQDGDILVGQYVSRRPGEEPRKSTYALKGEKIPALSVYVVLYSHAVLAEGNENETDADYEVVSINASPTEEEMPIPTGALIANHLGLSGGTQTKLSDDEFVAMLRKSIEFWKDKALAAPQELRHDWGKVRQQVCSLEIDPKIIQNALVVIHDIENNRLPAHDVYTTPDGIILEWQHPSKIIERIEIEAASAELMISCPNKPARFIKL